MKTHMITAIIALVLTPFWAIANPPQTINFQCKVEREGQAFNGVGNFKFAIVNPETNETRWSNDGTSVNGSEPSSAVSLNVVNGLLSVRLGNISIPNMGALSEDVFDSAERTVAVWFSEDGTSFEKLQTDGGSDYKIASVPYALKAQTAYSLATTGSVSGTADQSAPLTSILPRESVWPEHYGRGNTIHSYSFTRDEPFTNKTLFSTPLNGKFIITDIHFMADFTQTTKAYLYLYIHDVLDPAYPVSNDHLVFSNVSRCDTAQGIWEGTKTFHLKSGIPLDENQKLIVHCTDLNSWVEKYSVTVSGFHIGPGSMPNYNSNTEFIDYFDNGTLYDPQWNWYTSGEIVPYEDEELNLLRMRGGRLLSNTVKGFENSEIEVKIINSSGNINASIFVSYVDHSTYLRIGLTNTVALVAQCDRSVEFTRYSTNHNVNIGNELLVRIIYNNKQLELYLDGQRIFTFNDIYTSGENVGTAGLQGVFDPGVEYFIYRKL